MNSKKGGLYFLSTAYVKVEGEVDVVLESRGGESTVATLGCNEFFGEMAPGFSNEGFFIIS